VRARTHTRAPRGVMHLHMFMRVCVCVCVCVCVHP
jgi:hypothetical protein